MDTKKFLELVERKKKAAQRKVMADSDWAKKLEKAAIIASEGEDKDKKGKRGSKRGKSKKHKRHTSKGSRSRSRSSSPSGSSSSSSESESEERRKKKKHGKKGRKSRRSGSDGSESGKNQGTRKKKDRDPYALSSDEDALSPWDGPDSEEERRRNRRHRGRNHSPDTYYRSHNGEQRRRGRSRSRSRSRSPSKRAYYKSRSPDGRSRHQESRNMGPLYRSSRSPEKPMRHPSRSRSRSREGRFTAVDGFERGRYHGRSAEERSRPRSSRSRSPGVRGNRHDYLRYDPERSNDASRKEREWSRHRDDIAEDGYKRHDVTNPTKRKSKSKSPAELAASSSREPISGQIGVDTGSDDRPRRDADDSGRWGDGDLAAARGEAAQSECPDASGDALRKDSASAYEGDGA